MNLPRPETASRAGGVQVAVALVLLAATLVTLGAFWFRGPGVVSGGGLDLAALPESADAFGPVPDFELVDQRGRVVTRETLLGSPWVMATIFTRCTGPCPMISERMAKLQRKLDGTGVRLVSISVDPAYDTSERLATYAAAYDADPERWLFLTGSEAAVQALVTGGFWMSAVRAEDPDVPAGEAVTHDTRLVAVDAAGERRGWYDQHDSTEVGRLIERMRHLADQAAANR